MPSFIIAESLFRQVVYGSRPTVTPALRGDLPALCEHFSLNPAEATDLVKANSLLHTRIRDLLTSGSPGPRWREVKALHNQVLRHHLLNDITLRKILRNIQIFLFHAMLFLPGNPTKFDLNLGQQRYTKNN